MNGITVLAKTKYSELFHNILKLAAWGGRGGVGNPHTPGSTYRVLLWRPQLERWIFLLSTFQKVVSFISFTISRGWQISQDSKHLFLGSGKILQTCSPDKQVMPNNGWKKKGKETLWWRKLTMNVVLVYELAVMLVHDLSTMNHWPSMIKRVTWVWSSSESLAASLEPQHRHTRPCPEYMDMVNPE